MRVNNLRVGRPDGCEVRPVAAGNLQHPFPFYDGMLDRGPCLVVGIDRGDTAAFCSREGCGLGRPRTAPDTLMLLVIELTVKSVAVMV